MPGGLEMESNNSSMLGKMSQMMEEKVSAYIDVNMIESVFVSG